MTKLTKWYRIRRYFIPAAFLLIVVMIVLLCVVKDPRFLVIDGILMFFTFVFIVDVMNDVGHKINYFKKHIGLNDLSYMAKIHPIEMEQICFCRLQALAGALAKVECDCRTSLLVDERQKVTEASLQFKQAYWFFEKYQFIQPTDWKHFFPKSGAQK